MSKIDVVVSGNGTAWVDNYDPSDGENVTLYCNPNEGETLDDVEAWDSGGHSIAMGVVPVQTFPWSDAFVAMTILVTFSSATPTPKIRINIDGDGSAYVDNEYPETGDTVTLFCDPQPRFRIDSIIAYDENGNIVPFEKVRQQSFIWEYQFLDIYITFKRKREKRMPIWMYPIFWR